MPRRIGYVVPEFPGQSHTWIWRDCHALGELGIDVALVSTRRPAVLAPHRWAKQAAHRTDYLLPVAASDALRALREFSRVRRSAKCLVSIFDEAGVSVRDRARMLALLGFGAKLAALARAGGWQHLHVASLGDAALVVRFAAALSNLPYSVTLLSNLEHYGGHQRQKWQAAAFGIVVSKQLHEQVQGKLGAAAPRRLVIAPMGVNVAQWRRPTPYEPCSSQETLRIYACGRLNPSKGHRYLLEAVSLLLQRGVQLRLVIAGAEEGAPGYRGELVARADELGLADTVQFVGALGEGEHRTQLLRAHAFVLPSLDEGVSVAAMEAMALGVPTIATRVGGMGELIDSGVNGILVPSRQAGALADALADVMTNHAVARSLSLAARQVIVQRFQHRVAAAALALELELDPASSERLCAPQPSQ